MYNKINITNTVLVITVFIKVIKTMDTKYTRRALVLSSGGSRGALQVGAIQALYEMGFSPDIITGTSIGAANGAFLAVNGFSQEGITKLQSVWETTIEKDLLPTNLWWQFMRSIFSRTKGFSQDQIRAFAIENGVTPDLCFGDLKNIRFYPVASDLNAGIPVVFGDNPNDSVLDSILASMALPPWIAPIEKEEYLFIDGGATSNLPIEAAFSHGATEIVALDLSDPQDGNINNQNLSHLLIKLDMTVERRQKYLELELAEAHGIPVKHIVLNGDTPVPIWDFRASRELIERGYKLAYQAMGQEFINCKQSWFVKSESSDMALNFYEAVE